MIGVVKIKDGLFICDEYGAQVSTLTYKHIHDSELLWFGLLLSLHDHNFRSDWK